MLLRRLNAVMILVVMIAGTFCAAAQAQVSRLPRTSYYQIYSDFYAGDLTRANRNFQQGYRTAFQFGGQRFLDSVCYLTLIGECNYHVGNYAEALANYEQALNLYLSYNVTGWQSRIRTPATLTPDVAAFRRSNVSWGTPTRQTAYARVPSTFQVLFGRTDAPLVLTVGGVWNPAQTRSVDVTEIMRCTALAMHRRRQLLGPLNRLTPLSSRLLTALRVPGAGDGSIMGSYNGVLLGIALASMDRNDDAVRMLTRSLQINNQFDHSLTPVALTELTQLALGVGKKSTAATLALEASYSAGVFGQYDLVNEALSLGTTNHLLTLKTPYPPLSNAIAWANRDRARLTQFSLIQRLAECHAEAANARAARETIAAANTANRGRNSLGNSVANARLKYASAVTGFTEGNFAAGLSDLSAALTQFQNGSLWLFRLRLASDLVASKSVSELEADKLYASLLHDPTEDDWKVDPIEAMSFLSTDHVTAMENWFDILIRRRQYERAVQVAELIRRHRFYSTLPLGGRLLAFRHGLNAETKELDSATARQREKFLVRNGGYKELLTGSQEIQKQLLKLPLNPEPDTDESRKQRQLLGQLSQVSSAQEALMASYALSREPSNLAFPPQMALEDFKRLIPEGALTLSMLNTASGYHLFFVSRERIRYVKLGTTQGLNRAITKMLKDIGAIGGSATDAEKLNSEAWRESANEVKRGLFVDIPDESFGNVVELVVIPDGMLWYMPFEALPMTIDGREQFLVDLCPIRYAPTMYLSVEAPGGGALKRHSVAFGNMHSRGEVETTIAEVEELKKRFPDLHSYEKQTTPSGLSAWLTDHFMVWSESFIPNNGYAYQPVPFDASDHASISSWLSLPWYGPEYLSLPGLRSFGKGRKANGSEMFVTTVTLMAAGSRTIMLPRWPTGGAISLGLSRLYAENLSDDANGAKALRKAMIDSRDLAFDIEKEPQIKKEKDLGDISAQHPFFWSSFFVVDQPRLTAAAPAPGLAPVGKKPPLTAVAPGPGATSPTPSTAPGSGTKSPPTTGGKAADPAKPTPGSTTKPTSGSTAKPTPGSSAKPAAPRKPGGVF